MIGRLLIKCKGWIFWVLFGINPKYYEDPLPKSEYKKGSGEVIDIESRIATLRQPLKPAIKALLSEVLEAVKPELYHPEDDDLMVAYNNAIRDMESNIKELGL